MCRVEGFGKEGGAAPEIEAADEKLSTAVQGVRERVLPAARE